MAALIAFACKATCSLAGQHALEITAPALPWMHDERAFACPWGALLHGMQGYLLYGRAARFENHSTGCAMDCMKRDSQWGRAGQLTVKTTVPGVP